MTHTMFFHTTFGFTDCKGETLIDLVNRLIDIDPDVIQIDTPYRPYGEKFVKPVSVDELKVSAKDFEGYSGKRRACHKLRFWSARYAWDSASRSGYTPVFDKPVLSAELGSQENASPSRPVRITINFDNDGDLALWGIGKWRSITAWNFKEDIGESFSNKIKDNLWLSHRKIQVRGRRDGSNSLGG